MFFRCKFIFSIFIAKFLAFIQFFYTIYFTRKKTFGSSEFLIYFIGRIGMQFGKLLLLFIHVSEAHAKILEILSRHFSTIPTTVIRTFP
jgi:hypothetical protein